ncbi:Protein ABHD8 [Liparis tanakae]|uniref:Protein ABHD8 n=1 Tax=Liparis tanakae TaxID=230148 RepID=A0A4Z2E4Q0_9TELE|nr:Protein ABHD8 [Liparis tanakae]
MNLFIGRVDEPCRGLASSTSSCPPQILLLAFLKVLEDGGHMVMMESPEAVNTLLHEFILWEPAAAAAPPKKKESIATRPETAQTRSTAAPEPPEVRPATARQSSSVSRK